MNLLQTLIPSLTSTLRVNGVFFTLFLSFYSPLQAEAEEPNWSKLTIGEAYEYALKHNSDIRTVSERLRQQEGLIVQTRAARLPSLDANAQIKRIDSGLLPAFNGQIFGAQNNWSADVTVTQTLLSGGKNSAAHEREKLRLEAATFEVQSVVNSVLLSVQESFASVLLRRAQLDVRTKSTELLAEVLRNEEAKLRAGTVSDFNVLRAKVELANSQTPLIRGRNELKLSREDLRRLLGLSEDGVAIGALDVDGALTFSPRIADLDESIRTALTARPELKRLEVLVKAEESGIVIARSGFLPKVDVFGGWAVQQSPFERDIDSDPLDGWQVGARSSWNLFNSFGTVAQVDQALSQREQAKIALRQAKLDTEVETRRAVSSLIEAQELVKSSKEVVSQAEESLRRARVRFDSGVGTQLEVLDAQVALTDARSNEVSALYEYVVASARFDRALGNRPKT